MVKAIRGELLAAGIGADLLTVDFFLYEVGQSAVPTQKQAGLAEPGAGADFDHDEMKEAVKNIGLMLGFDVQTEVPIARGAKVDVVWRAKIGNLGRVTYVFEVHKAGSIDSLILNLQKAKGGATVQKVVAISDERQLAKIRQECEELPEEFRKALAYWPVNQVLEVAKGLGQATQIMDNLGLVPLL
ncbi:MAG: hypothetical protein HYX89_07005 [Chloroflexi bacterium]|nr:hypothetical protein [Chloroflexota bacterium]